MTPWVLIDRQTRGEHGSVEVWHDPHTGEVRLFLKEHGMTTTYTFSNWLARWLIPALKEATAREMPS